MKDRLASANERLARVLRGPEAIESQLLYRVARPLLTITGFRASVEAKALAPDPALLRLLAGGDPATPQDLQLLQAHVQAVLAKVGPATVALDGATGVIIKDHLVLTAGHVTRTNCGLLSWRWMGSRGSVYSRSTCADAVLGS